MGRDGNVSNSYPAAHLPMREEDALPSPVTLSMMCLVCAETFVDELGRWYSDDVALTGGGICATLVT